MKLTHTFARILFLVALSAFHVLRAVDDIHTRDVDGNTPLHLAALHGNAGAVEALLKRGSDANAINHAGATPLHYATASDRMVASLLECGATVDAVSSLNVTPLRTAVSRPDSYAVARRLIAAGANVNYFKPPRGAAPQGSILTMAILAGDHRTIELLLEHGAEVNPGEGILPLAAAALVGDIETTKLLLEHHADANYRSSSTETPLVSAARTDHYEVASLLIERGADINIPYLRRTNMTPLMVMSAYNDTGSTTLARLLVAHGADVNATNDYGETALAYALKRGDDTPMTKFLREAGGQTAPRPDRKKAIPSRDVPTELAARTAMVRASVQRAIDLIQPSSKAFLANSFVHDQAKCTSCHQQALPAVVFRLASERGLRVDEHELGRSLHAIITELRPTIEATREMVEPVPNARITLGFDLDALHAQHYPSDAITDAMALYILERQLSDGSWNPFVRRPPIEDGPLVGTAWAVRALQVYPPTGDAHDVEAALGRARGWLSRQVPSTPNERVFQLLGLAWANESTERLRPFAERLIRAQRDDGSWAQLPDLVGDAWATGSALVALQKAGVAATDPAYQRGVSFLLRTQFEDGSWWVRSRSQPAQPHFDANFPHGKDQWISTAATAWATMALLLMLEPTVEPTALPDARQLIAVFEKSASLDDRKSAAWKSVAGPAAPAIIDFGHDIQPLFNRSCVNCHSGAKPKGSLTVTSREGLLKGGQSGEPAVVPGYVSKSQLLRYVTGEIEDLEMPPLNRREKYPALTSNEVARLQTWIEAGAP